MPRLEKVTFNRIRVLNYSNEQDNDHQAELKETVEGQLLVRMKLTEKSN